jgi:hypothetical protein
MGGDAGNAAFVRCKMKLTSKHPTNYPLEPLLVTIQESRGLDDEQIQSIVSEMQTLIDASAVVMSSHLFCYTYDCIYICVYVCILYMISFILMRFVCWRRKKLIDRRVWGYHHHMISERHIQSHMDSRLSPSSYGVIVYEYLRLCNFSFGSV